MEEEGRKPTEPSMVVDIGSPSTQEAEARGWKVQNQPGLHCQNLSPFRPSPKQANKQPPVLEQFETTDVKLLSNHIIELSLGNEPMITCVLSKQSTI